MKKIFLSNVQTELNKCKANNEVFTEEDISNLPSPVQRYFRYCGYIGTEKMTNVKFLWDDVNFKIRLDKPWTKMEVQQYNFASEPGRITYMYIKMFGIIPMEAKEEYLNGKGTMLGKLLKKVTIFDNRGSETNASQAINYLAESLFVPTCALQQNILWQYIDQNHVKAIYEYKGVKVEGILTFNDKGEYTKFETEDRYMDTGGGTLKKTKWTAEVCNYVEKNGIAIPSDLKAIWNLPTGDFEYFNGTLTNIVHNNTRIN
ncbi:DUF6544 family protein [Pelosinus sp. UFO1]|uniref:DUF6544 family protein n=1 Tax=Pelosinus sp. UFO1 TaxID=484770 RepID=UPI0004D1DCAE|nr:DUF6544 family protein [Pelosinus sp. UFO1]AIF51810.1 hypothetical protein UFO1_2263 [Pelosinus sp. UFO1]